MGMEYFLAYTYDYSFLITAYLYDIKSSSFFIFLSKSYWLCFGLNIDDIRYAFGIFWFIIYAFYTLILKSFGFWLFEITGPTYLNRIGYELLTLALIADFWLSSLLRYCDVAIFEFLMLLFVMVSSAFGWVNEKFD